METPPPHEEWLNRGCQRRAVSAVLNRPMTSSQILEAARKIAPRIQLRDIWLILKQMRERDLVNCLNPEASNGKLFYFASGDWRSFYSSVSENSHSQDHSIELLSWLVRGRLRLTICELLADEEFRYSKGLTPTELKRAMMGCFPVCKNSLLRTLNELRDRELIVWSSVSRHSRSNRFLLSEKGRILVLHESIAN